MAVKVTVKRSKARNRRAPKAARAAKQTNPGLLGQALRQLGTYGGGALGGMFGVPAAGAAAGNSLGAAISKWLGSGDYSVGSNTIVSRSLKSTDSIPAMHRDGQSIIVRHKEYLGEISGSTAFNVVGSYELNPGNSQTFPWLSGVASRFQEYKFKGVVFHYIPSSGNAVSSTNAALGTVMMQTSYRSNDTAPSGKLEMLNEYWSSESVPSEGFCHPIECDPKENPFNVQYVRTGAIPSNDSPLLYDLGVTHVAVSGQQSGTGVLGDLWISYEVELKKPILASNVTAPIEMFQARYNPATSNDWFSGAPTDTLGTLGVTAATRTITLPKGSQGRWLIVILWEFNTYPSSVDMSTIGATTLGNCVPTAVYPSRTPVTGQNIPTMVAGGPNRIFCLYAVQISDPGKVATVAFPSNGLVLTGSWTPSYCMLSVTPLQ